MGDELLAAAWSVLCSGSGARKVSPAHHAGAGAATAGALDGAGCAEGNVRDALECEYTVPGLGGSVRFTGHVRDGWRSGRGRVTTDDDAVIEATWEAGVPCGPIKLTSGDEGTITAESVTEAGLCGSVTEHDDDGDLRFEGAYVDGYRHCKAGREILPCGAELHGQWIDGVFTGPHNQYLYPGGRSWLDGQWGRDGQMVAAAAFASGDSDATDGKSPHPDVPPSHRFSYDQSDGRCASLTPTIGDPHERACTFPAVSMLHGGGTGLFARVPLERGLVVAYYNGVRLPVDVANGRSWADNEYTISLYSEEQDDDDEATALDLPAAMLSSYSATLGHLVNHSDHPNIEFEFCIHPRFGSIKCLRTLDVVAAGSELYADYGYGEFRERTPPPWFEERSKPDRQD